MFKAVDTSRAWGDTGMTTAKWMELPVELLFIDWLIATQPGVLFEYLIANKPSFTGDPYPHVVAWRDEFYLEDGHHRVVRQMMTSGDRVVAVRILDLR